MNNDPTNLTQTAALPVDLYIAPMNLTCKTLRISVKTLAMKALATRATEVAAANVTWFVKIDSIMIAEPVKRIEARGKPRRFAKADATVCSSQVIGSQYGAWIENLAPLR